jgi:hypothetical protein
MAKVIPFKPSNIDGIWTDLSKVNGRGLSPQEKFLFSMIDHLCKRKEGCTASNKYFAEILETTEKAVSDGISRLIKKKFVKSFSSRTKNGTKRCLWTDLEFIPQPTPENAGCQENVATPENEDATPENAGCMHSSKTGPDSIEIIYPSEDNIDLDSSGTDSSSEPPLFQEENPSPKEEKPSKSIRGHKGELEPGPKSLLEAFIGLSEGFRKPPRVINYPKEYKALKWLLENLGNRDEILRYGKAFIAYLKDGKGQYSSTAPILPSQLTEPVINRIHTYLDKDTEFTPTENQEIVYIKKKSFEEIL